MYYLRLSTLLSNYKGMSWNDTDFKNMVISQGQEMRLRKSVCSSISFISNIL